MPTNVAEKLCLFMFITVSFIMLGTGVVTKTDMKPYIRNLLYSQKWPKPYKNRNNHDLGKGFWYFLMGKLLKKGFHFCIFSSFVK